MVAIAAHLFLYATLAKSEDRERLPVLTRIAQIKQLPVEEAKKGYPVDVTGVLTFADSLGELFVQDDTAGAYVFLADTRTIDSRRTGDRVRITGKTTPGDFAPAIAKAEMQFLGVGAMPVPWRVNIDPLIAGKADCRWVEVSGVARSGQFKRDILVLDMASSGGNFLLRMPNARRDWTNTLIDARITVRGVLLPIFNQRRQSIAFMVSVGDSRFVRIDSPAPVDPFGLPLASTLTIGQFQPTADPDRRVHVRGTLLAVGSKSQMFIADQNGNLQLDGDSSCRMNPGDLMDVAGFPAAIDNRPGLQSAICQPAGRGIRFPITPVTPLQLIPAGVHDDAGGYGISAGTQYDLKPVSIEGTLLQSSLGPDGQTWSLENDGEIFIATVPYSREPGSRSERSRAERSRAERSLAERSLAEQGGGVAEEVKAEPGARFRLTGICVLNYDHYRRAQSFRILVRSTRDVTLIAGPAWRSLKLAALTVGALAFLFVIALVWASALKRQADRQTRELQEANTKLKRLSSLDSLTCTANRRHFDEGLTLEVIRMRRSGKTLSLLMIDIDFFKPVNDLLGHQKGDACLIQIAQAMQSVVRRGTDLICRYGGEEFAVILPGTSHEDATGLAEEIRKAVEDLRIPHPTSPFQSITVSIGISAIPSGAEFSAEDVVAAADAALYEAKRLGRNQVAWSSIARCEANQFSPVGA